MALKWIIGDFATGNISMTAPENQLPVVANSGDKVNIDINGAESATIAVSKKDLPSDWRTFLKPLDKFVALVDPDLAWGSSVIWAGFINKAQAAVNDTVKIQAAGLREYMAMRIVSKTYNSTVSNPDTTITFNGSTHQRLMANMILDCFSSSGIPSSAPKPPQILRSVSGSGSGTTYKHTVNLADFETYSNMLDAWRDELSDAGQEYKFTPSWDSSAMTRIRWTGAVAPVSASHFNEATTYSIDLNSDAWMPTAYSQSSSTDNMVSRIIGQSKSGEGDTGSDYTTKTTTSGSSILVDETWNPGVELTTAEMTTQLTQRLSYNSQTYKEASFERAYSTVADLRTIMGYLGGTATFTGSGASQYFGLTMRIVGLSFSPSKRIVEIDLAPKAARYPRLPKDRRNLKPRQETTNTGRPKTGPGGIGDYGKYTNPIVPPEKPGDNGTTPIPGGIPKPPVIPTPPPFDTTNPKDIYTDEESIFEEVDRRWFKTDVMLGNEAGVEGIPIDYFHPYPVAVRSRFNHETGEYIGLNMARQNLYGIDRSDGNNLREMVSRLKVYSLKIPQMFNRDENPYQNERQRDTTAFADDFKQEVGEIPLSMYDDLVMSIEDYRNSTPSWGISRYDKSDVYGSFDYIFFCSEDLQTLYVQIIFTVSGWNIVSGDSKYSYSASFSKTFKGVRNNEGFVEAWENLGQTLVKDPTSAEAQIYVSPNIYEINGEFHSFGGYLLPRAENAEEIFVASSNRGGGVLPSYALKFYTANYYKIAPEEEFVNNPVQFELPGSNGIYRSSDTNWLKLFVVPLGVNIDYPNNKIIIGIGQGVDNRSVFYESSFDNILSFVKIIDTKRFSENPAYFGGVMGSARTGSNPFTYVSKAPISYGENYLYLAPSGETTSRSGNYITINNESGTANNNPDKAIKYLRSKKGFEDVVEGAHMFPQATGNHSSNTMKESLNTYKHSLHNGNLLSAYSMYHRSSSSYPLHTSLTTTGGFDYYIYNGYLYVINDSRLLDSYSLIRDTAGYRGGQDNRYLYWVGKFKIDETKL